MSSTYLGLHYHLVFSTKGRVPSIDASWRSELHAYLGGTIRGLGGVPEAVGGVAEHVHPLVGLKATHCLADVMRELKKAASIWVHDKRRRLCMAGRLRGVHSESDGAGGGEAVYCESGRASSGKIMPRGVN